MALGALLAVAVSTVAVTPWAAVDPAVAIRNAALMLGVVALCGPRGASTAMLGLAVFACASWILGAGGQGSPPAWWAVLLHPLDDNLALGLCAATFVAGTVVDAYRRE